MDMPLLQIAYTERALNWDTGKQLNETLRDQGGHMIGYMILSAAAGLVLARLLGWVWR